MPKRKPRRQALLNPDDSATWPVIWRVVAPGCGSYDHDMLFMETELEVEARIKCNLLRDGGWPVRLERVSCGPMPKGYAVARAGIYARNAQNPHSQLSEVPAAWEVRP